MSKVLNNGSMSIVFVTAAAVTNTIAFERKPTLHLLFKQRCMGGCLGDRTAHALCVPEKGGNRGLYIKPARCVYQTFLPVSN